METINIDAYDPEVIGAKGLVYIGDKILIYRRDTNTKIYPLYLDVPGGGVEGTESPFEAFRREVREEFSLDISRSDITHNHSYASPLWPGRLGCFAVAKLPAEVEYDIVFGDEGLEYMLMSPEDFVAHTDAWPIMREQTQRYLQSTAVQAAVSATT